jgi:hypothetical protein
MTPLQALVVKEQKRRGWNDGQVVDASNGALGRSNWMRLRRNLPPFTAMPRRDTLLAIAKVFDLPLLEVETAAAQTVGYEMSPTRLSANKRMILAALDGLSPDSEAEVARRVVDIVNSLEKPR